jgi:predicted metal-dependent hydrolase
LPQRVVEEFWYCCHFAIGYKCWPVNMQETQSKSPEDLSINLRRPTFELERALAGDWHGGNAFRTAFFNAMSMLFPLGEKFFIDSVRAFRAEIEDQRLLAEITAFQGQESIHRLEHQRYNELLCELRGYDLDAMEEPSRRRQEWVRRNMSKRRQLAGTVAAEHITAIMADAMLRHEDAMRGADPVIAELWRWHGIEETEHKSVAFDVYTAVGGNLKERRQALLFSTWYFFKDTFYNMRLMMRHDRGSGNLREWLKGLNFLFGKPGILRRIIPHYLAYYRKDFHPWQIDNRDLIDNWSREEHHARGL